MDLVHSESESNLRGSVSSKGSVVSNLSNVLRLSILSMEPTSLKIASGQVSQNPGMFSDKPSSPGRFSGYALLLY